MAQRKFGPRSCRASHANSASQPLPRERAFSTTRDVSWAARAAEIGAANLGGALENSKKQSKARAERAKMPMKPG
jgi:hypothetical protein